MHQALTSGQPAALTQALSGLGGIGKTQLAVEYAYRHATDYALVWWVRAEESVTLASDYANLATALQLPERDASDQAAIAEAVRRWLEQHIGWLLVFDNAEESAVLRPYLPRGTAGMSSSPPGIGPGGVSPVRYPCGCLNGLMRWLFFSKGLRKPTREPLGHLPRCWVIYRSLWNKPVPTLRPLASH